MTSAGPVIRRSADVVYRELPEGAGLLHLTTGTYFSLNPTGAMIWARLADEPTLDELVDDLREAIPDPPDALEGEVDAFVAELRDRGLIELVTPPG